MFLQLSSLALLLLSSLASAQEVEAWLQRMGCEALLAVYLEDTLEHGDKNEKARAARDLAQVYAVLLARGDEEENKEILLRASSLFSKNPEAGTDELRVQLYRGTYIASEQLLERYRQRISTRSEADAAFGRMVEVAENLTTLRTSLEKKIRSSKTSKDKTRRQFGLATSYLAWATYYIAWHQDDPKQAKVSAQLFAEILLGESPELSSVSIDLKSHEAGARAVLGIALCKSIIEHSEGAEPWLNELEGPETWSSVRAQIPLWRFYLHIDSGSWEEILKLLSESYGVNQSLMCRVAAAHAHENLSHPTAKRVAEKSLSILVESGQLGIIRDLIQKYETVNLPVHGFIYYYIKGDIAYRNSKKEYPSDEPLQNQMAKSDFAKVATLFRNALNAIDSKEYPSLISDCQYMLGLSLFYSSQFEEAAILFQQAAEGDKSEPAVWMAIVNFGYLQSLTAEQKVAKSELIESYISNWPNTDRATELTLYMSSTENVTFQTIEDLLAIPHSDSKYEKAQRLASRSLYALWENASKQQKVSVGNKYISVALPLMYSDLLFENDFNAAEICAVRALRILEIALHPKVKRLVAAQRAIDTIDEIRRRGSFSFDPFQNEIAFRTIALHVLMNESDFAQTALLELILKSPEDVWAIRAAKLVWSFWRDYEIEVDSATRFAVGRQLLSQIEEYEYGTSFFISIAIQTAQSGFDLYSDNGDKSSAAEALRISRILVEQKEEITEVLLLNAELEMELGNRVLARKRWEALSSGSKTGTLIWTRARCNTILLLAEDSPQKALQVLNQYQALYPDYGKEPYGSTLRLLHRKLQGSNDGS